MSDRRCGVGEKVCSQWVPSELIHGLDPEVRRAVHVTSRQFSGTLSVLIARARECDYEAWASRLNFRIGCQGE